MIVGKGEGKSPLPKIAIQELPNLLCRRPLKLTEKHPQRIERQIEMNTYLLTPEA